MNKNIFNFNSGYVRFLLIAKLAFILSACEVKQNDVKPALLTTKDGYVVTSTAGYNMERVNTVDEMRCAPPPPDAVITEGAAENFNLLTFHSDKGTFDESTTDVEKEMSGRTSFLLYSREMFYRLCEFGRNFKLSKEEYLILFKETMLASSQVMLESARNKNNSQHLYNDYLKRMLTHRRQENAVVIDEDN